MALNPKSVYTKSGMDCLKSLAFIAVRPIRTDGRTEGRTDGQTDGASDDSTLGALKGPRVKIRDVKKNDYMKKNMKKNTQKKII